MDWWIGAHRRFAKSDLDRLIRAFTRLKACLAFALSVSFLVFLALFSRRSLSFINSIKSCVSQGVFSFLKQNLVDLEGNTQDRYQHEGRNSY